MRYLFGLGGAAFVLSLATPLAAQKMYGPGGSTIYPIDGSSFEVVATSRDKAMWCGAAKYARRALKVGWNTQLVVTRGPEPSVLEDGRRPGVQFTTNPAAAGVAPVAENGGLAPGSWRTVSIANRNCARLDNSSNR